VDTDVSKPVCGAGTTKPTSLSSIVCGYANRDSKLNNATFIDNSEEIEKQVGSDVKLNDKTHVIATVRFKKKSTMNAMGTLQFEKFSMSRKLENFENSCFALINKQDRTRNQTSGKANDIPAIFERSDDLDRDHMVAPEVRHTSVTSRYVKFDELRASAERAKHIDAAKRLSRGYNIIVPEQQLKLEEKRELPTPVQPAAEMKEKADREILRNAKSIEPNDETIAEYCQLRRSTRLNFAEISEVVFEDDSVGDINEVRIDDPDIAFAVGMLSKFLDKAGEMHWAAAIRVLLYLKGTMTYGLPLGGEGNNSSLISYC
jgi:hypothetical protein